MTVKTILNEFDIREIIAEHFNMDVGDVHIEHKSKCVGYYGEEEVPYIEIEIEKII